ncbi:MAG: pilin [Candidatus Berkelbacteria bacterium]|nr:pilin [Candidatus Berkelbacteria bacterium]
MDKTKKVTRVAVYSFGLMALLGVLLASQAHAQGIGWSVPNPFDFQNLDLQTVIARLINVAFIAAGLVAVIYLIIGGFRYVTSSGNAEAIEGAKATILNAIIGLIVIFISFLLVNYILGAIGIHGFIYQPQQTTIY